MNSLRIKREDIYEIEVNDKGETIEFPLEDVELPLRLKDAYDGVSKIQKDVQAKLVIINKQQDNGSREGGLTKNEYEIAKVWRDAFRAMRVEMDKFLGDGGCQKIFGNSNYLGMYDDLYEELTRPQEDGLSHFDRMKLTSESIKDRITKKYEKYLDKEVVI